MAISKEAKMYICFPPAWPPIYTGRSDQERSGTDELEPHRRDGIWAVDEAGRGCYRKSRNESPARNTEFRSGVALRRSNSRSSTALPGPPASRRGGRGCDDELRRSRGPRCPTRSVDGVRTSSGALFQALASGRL